MLPSLSSRIAVLGAIVILALLAFAGFLLNANRQMSEGFRWVTHSAQVIETMGDAMVELRDAESGQRGFVLTQNPAFTQSFEKSVKGARQHLSRVIMLTQDNPVQNVRAREIMSLAEQRIAVMREPLDLGRRGAFDEARAAIANGHGRDLMTSVTLRVQGFMDEERAVQTMRIERAGRQLDWVRQLAIIGGTVLAILVGSMCFFIIRGIRRPLDLMKRAMAELGDGDRKTRILANMGSREFSRLARDYNAMADQLEAAVSDQVHSERQLQTANQELKRNSDTLQERGEVIELLGGMAHRMQAARTDDELAQIIRVFVPRVLLGVSGALYAHNNSRNLLVPIASWGDMPSEMDSFSPDECWALRRGQSHFITEPGGDILCAHVGEVDPIYHCEPLLAGGEVIGVLYLRGLIHAEQRFRLAVLAENIASALVNHRLQRGLREQTIRDPLTGLFNRRYMEETLGLEIARSVRSGAPLSLIMCDVDHFKRFNDEFGHDAGDSVLQTVAAEMRSRFRAGDVVCRYGGEEFTIIAPGTTSIELLKRVELVRQAIADLNVRQSGRTLGSVSMSFGIATWNQTMARDGSTLIQAADAALYRAKREGRNRAVVDEREAA